MPYGTADTDGMDVGEGISVGIDESDGGVGVGVMVEVAGDMLVLRAVLSVRQFGLDDLRPVGLLPFS